MTKHWLQCVEDAERLLGLAKARYAVPAKVPDLLYEAMVMITKAINELEMKREKV